MDGLVKMIKRIQRSAFHHQGIPEKQREVQGMSLSWKEANVLYRVRGGYFRTVSCYGAQCYGLFGKHAKRSVCLWNAEWRRLLPSDVRPCSLLAIESVEAFTCNTVTHFSLFNFKTRYV